MTKERFIFDGFYIRDTLNKIPPIMTYNDKQRNEFLDGLNGLAEENKELYNENLKLKKEIESMNTTKWDGTCECCGGTNLYNVINDVYECVDCGTRICLGDLEDE